MADATDAQRWLALQRNSLQWPKHWRAAIYRVEQVTHAPDIMRTVMFRVLPRNPEYQEYVANTSLDQLATKPAPRPYLDAIEFDSLEELDMWASVVSRLGGSSG